MGVVIDRHSVTAGSTHVVVHEPTVDRSVRAVVLIVSVLISGIADLSFVVLRQTYDNVGDVVR